MRPSELGEVEISVTPPKRLPRKIVDRYEAIGGHGLIAALNVTTLDGALRFVAETDKIASG